MPKVPKNKQKRSITLDIGLIHTIQKKAKHNDNGFSQEIENALKTIYFSNKEYIEYELKRATETLDAIKFRILKHNSDSELKKMLRKL